MNTVMPSQNNMLNSIHYRCLSAILLYGIVSVINATTLDAKNINPGKNIYLNGILASGENLQAVLRKDVTISGEQAACVNCHRRSGLGTTEGQTIVMDITSRTLFSDITLKARRYLQSESNGATLERPAYTHRLLKQAIVQGIRSNGKPLNHTMPRYTLTDHDYNNLFTYLTTLSSKPSEGVTDKVFHIATIIDTAAPDEEIHAMQQVITQYVNEYNTETRYESKRVKHAPIQKEWHYETYRKIQHHFWLIDTDINQWRNQLDRYYMSQPVFAVISGLSHRSWGAVDAFCNDYALPCIFPTVDHPDASSNNYYSLYFSKGIALEAEALAKHLQKQASNNPIHVLHLINDKYANDKAPGIITNSLSHNNNIKLERRIISSTDTGHKSTPGDDWDSYDAIILSLSNTQISELVKKLNSRGNTNQTQYYAFSNAKFDKGIIDAVRQLDLNFFIVSPYVDQTMQKRKMLRASVWAKSRKIDIKYPRILSDTFTAFMIAGNALRHLRGNYYRDYLLELLEHKVERSVVSSLYPQLTIGPGQRYAAKACRIEKVSDSFNAVTPWIAP